jgi:hypothetical protein
VCLCLLTSLCLLECLFLLTSVCLLTLPTGICLFILTYVFTDIFLCLLTSLCLLASVCVYWHLPVCTDICCFGFLQEVDTLLITNFGELETVMGNVLQSKYVIRGFLPSQMGFSLLNFPVLVGWDPVYNVCRTLCLSDPYHSSLPVGCLKKEK